MDPRRLERIRKRKADDDDEMLFFILPALYLHLTQTEKNKRHSSILYGKKRVRELLDGHVKNCLTAFRMEPHIFRWLASYLRNEGLISDSILKVEEKLAFFLYTLSHNASYEDLQLEFQHSGSTFHTYIKEFFDIVPILATKFVRPPRYIDEPHPRIAMDDRFFPYFEVPSFSLTLQKFLSYLIPIINNDIHFISELYRCHRWVSCCCH